MRFKLDPFSPSGLAVEDERPTRVVQSSNGYLGESGVQDIIASTNITIDKTDPKRPIISSTGGGGGGTGAVDSVVAGTGITVNSTDPSNPVIATTITQYTDEKAQDAIGSALTDTATLDFTYDDVGNTISAAVLDSPTLQSHDSAYHLNSDNHTNGTTNKVYTATEKTKLAGVATGATANSSDAVLEARANHTGTQTASTISDFSTAADARISAAAGVSVASLSGGKIPSSQIPAVGLVSVQTAASQAAQLALTTQEGDVVVRTDTSVTYMRNAGTAGTMADFTLLNTPTAPVTSVNSQTGVVVLASGDVGLGNVDNTSDATKNAAVATLTNKSISGGQITSAVANATLAASVTTNANLTGPITSTGNATAVASQTGTGSKFVMDTAPALVTPALGVATATSVNKVAITAPATSATLTIPNGVTLTGPASSGTAATLGNAETITGAKTFGAAANVGKLIIAGSTSGTTILNAAAVAGSGTVVLPTTGTLATLAGTEVFTNKDLSSSTNIVPSGSTVQVVSTQTSAVATGTTTIPADDTIPQNTEGDQYMSVSITPKSTTNHLFIEVKAQVSHSTSVADIMGALFQDTTASALAAGFITQAGTTYKSILTIGFDMAAGTTSATTFKFRAGGGAVGTLTLNGNAGVRLFGGVLYSYIKITEYKP